MDLVEMEFPLDPIERLEFGDSSVDVAALDPAYIVRVENAGAVSVVAAMAEGICGDEADSVGPAQDLHNLGSDVESVREVRTNRVQPSSSMVEQQKDPRETLLWTTDMLIQCSTPCM